MVELAVMAKVIVEFALMVGLVLGGEVTGAVAVVVAVGLATAVCRSRKKRKKVACFDTEKGAPCFRGFRAHRFLRWQGMHSDRVP